MERLRLSPGQTDESASVFLTQDAQQGGEADSGVLRKPPLGKHDRNLSEMTSESS